MLDALLALLLATPALPGAALLDAPAPSPSTRARPACPADMLPVEGVHREIVERLCLDYRQGRCFSFLPGLWAAEGEATPVRTCMDRFEWPNRAGARPAVMVSFVEAKALCAGAGKRLCTEYEWELACEGPDVLPFPYGHAADPEACNSGKPYRPVSEAKLSSSDPSVRGAETERAWQGEPSGSRPRCTSPYGVADLVGNVEEWVSTSRPMWPWPSSLKGGYWSKPWTGCRGTNESHGPAFRFYEIGLRCCKDPDA